MIKTNISVTLVSLIFIGLSSCSDKASSDSEVINTDYINRENMSNSSTYNTGPDINFDTNNTISNTDNNKADESPSALETNPQGYSKITGGNTGSTWSGD